MPNGSRPLDGQFLNQLIPDLEVIADLPECFYILHLAFYADMN